MKALIETFSDHDLPQGGSSERRCGAGKAGTLRIDLQGVTIDRLVVEVRRE